jgi:hypothetical protein
MSVREVRLRHELVRQGIFRRSLSALKNAYPNAMTDVAITGISPPVLDDWREVWRDHPKRRVTWDWERLISDYRNRYDRVEAAVWRRGRLCGLLLGKMSSARTVVSVNFVEADPDRMLAGRVLLIAAEVAVSFGVVYGSTVIRFTEPIEPVRFRLRHLGFDYVAHRPGVRYAFSEKVLL